MEKSAAVTARQRVRAALMAEILHTAREHLVETGPVNLSVRAVARDLGMASSAIYRYVPSRDALLTMLIVDAYNSLGEAVEAADGGQEWSDVGSRWVSACRAMRDWALENPQRWALIYGSPVPGYAAPQETIVPASRVPVVLVGILAVDPLAPAEALPQAVQTAIAPVLGSVGLWTGGEAVSPRAVALGVMAWTHLIGTIGMELFGHRHNVVGDSAADREAYFDFEVEQLAGLLGLPT